MFTPALTFGFATLSVVVVVLVARAWAKASERRKREREQSVGSVASLEPSPIATGQRTLPSSHEAAALIAKLDAALRELDVRVVRATNTELIGFFGDANQSKVDGMLNTTADVMPVRIAVSAESTSEGSQVTIQVDEDYGFQLFAGPAKKAFWEKNDAAVALWLDRVSALL